MVTKKTIKVPIFDYKIVIIVADTFEEVSSLYPEVHYCNGCVLEGLDNSSVIIPPNKSGVLVHECVHLKNAIWKYIGYKPIEDNDEVDAYLVQYLFNQVSKVVDKHNLATHC